MVANSLKEDQIEASLRRIRENGLPITGEKTDRPMKALIQHWDQFFSGIEPLTPKPQGP
jgi:hypothetical protein